MSPRRSVAGRPAKAPGSAQDRRSTPDQGTECALRFFVPGKPLPKGSPAILRHRISGRPFVRESPAEKSWETIIGQLAKVTLYSRYGMIGWPLSGPVRVRLVFELKATSGGKLAHEKPHADLDKLARACCDALAGIAYFDDCQVTVLEVRKRIAEVEPGVHVEVSEDRSPPTGGAVWMEAM